MNEYLAAELLSFSASLLAAGVLATSPRMPAWRRLGLLVCATWLFATGIQIVRCEAQDRVTWRRK